jgi:hypothetical protein
MYGGCHKISQVCCGINLKFEKIWRSISSIDLPDFCDAKSSPFCYSDAMGPQPVGTSVQKAVGSSGKR